MIWFLVLAIIAGMLFVLFYKKPLNTNLGLNATPPARPSSPGDSSRF